MTWFSKYCPKKFTEILAADETNFAILKWLKNNKYGAINIFGPSGVGKSVLARCVASSLNYRIVDYEDIRDEDVKKIGNSNNLESKKNILIIDEGDNIPYHTLVKFKSVDYHVIYTTLIPFKEFQGFKLSSLSSHTILYFIKKILKLENRSLDDRVILSLCGICNGDLRAILNYCELFSNIKVQNYLKMIDRTAAFSSSAQCRKILSKIVKLEELESMYSEWIAEACLGSVIENNSYLLVNKAFEDRSEFSIYPESYRFLSLDSVNKIRGEYHYRKEEQINTGKYDIALQFLPLYKRNLQNKRLIKHLQEVFDKYSIVDLSPIDIEIKNYKEYDLVEKRIFKYKYNMGSSNAVKRDISISELIDL